MSVWRKLREDERGAAMITAIAAVIASLVIAVLAIDVGTMMLAKTQLQNAADAAALAGAMGYYLSDGDQGAATDAAVEVAGLNYAQQTGKDPVLINSGDVTFPAGDRVRVQTHRFASEGEGVALHFLKVLDPDNENWGTVTATATAKVYQIGATSCIKPWCFPDHWEDLDGDGEYDAGEPYDPIGTGYTPDNVGELITLKIGDPHGIGTGWCYTVRFPPLTATSKPISGADEYEKWIQDCEPYLVKVGDSLQLEEGVMAGKTNKPVDSLISLDPGAYWDAATNTVISDYPGASPRIVKVTTFDPTLGTQDSPYGGTDFVTVTKVMVVFLEERPASKVVVGRFMRMATDGEICPECPPGFVYTSVLVE